jgi:tagatose 6-phosphate kinase
MVQTARELGRDTIVDTHGPALGAALAARPWMVKPNREELEAGIGFPLEAEESQWKALHGLAERGIAVAALSLGAAGLRCLWESQAWEVIPPSVSAVNALGSGDSFVAGVAWARLRGEPPAECLRFGVACGAANAAVWDPGGIDAVSVAALLPRVTVREVGT